MQFTYDLDANALYVYLREHIIDSQIEADDGSIIDIDNRGQVVGIEILSPKDGFNIDEIKRCVELSPDENNYLLQLNALLPQHLRSDRSDSTLNTKVIPAVI